MKQGLLEIKPSKCPLFVKIAWSLVYMFFKISPTKYVSIGLLQAFDFFKISKLNLWENAVLSQEKHIFKSIVLTIMSQGPVLKPNHRHQHRCVNIQLSKIFSFSSFLSIYSTPFYQRYKNFHELYKVHKMKNMHQGWCLLRDNSCRLFFIYLWITVKKTNKLSS